MTYTIQAGEPGKLRTIGNDSNPMSAACLAESYFINNNCGLVQVVTSRGVATDPANGKEMKWVRVS